MKPRTSTFLFVILTALLTFGWLTDSAHGQEAGDVETFDDPTLPGWEHTPNAQVIDGVLVINGDGFAIHPSPTSSGNLKLIMRFDGDGFFELRYHLSDSGTYLLRVQPGEVQLVREAGGRQTVLASTPMTLTFGEWWILEMSISDGEQHVLLGPGIELHATDLNPLPEGGLLLHVYGEAQGEFDNLALGTPGQAIVEKTPTGDFTASSHTPGEIRTLTWIRTGGPPGGLGYDIRYNFANPDTWYVTDNYAGVHVSTDNGKTWFPSNSGIPKQSGPTGDAIPVFCLTVDPLDPQIVWIGTDITGHIYKSLDAGKTWVEKDEGITIDYDTLTFRGFTIDPRSSDIVYAMGETSRSSPAGVGGVVYKTTDGGESWNELWDGGMPSSLARYMWINPQNPDILYVSTGIFDRSAVGEAPDYETNPDPFGGLGILKSSDGGRTWRFLNEANGLEHLYIGSLFMHPEDPDILLAAAGHLVPEVAWQRIKAEGHSPLGIYRTMDGGENWAQVFEPPPDRGYEVFSSIEICPSDPNIAYAGSDLAIYRSEDAGITWNLVAGGIAWGPPGVRAGWPIDMQCDPRDTNRVFANNYSGGNFLSEDGGQTWTNASNGYTGAQVINLAVDPFDAAHVFGVGRSGAWETDDGGATWHALRNLPEEFPFAGGEWGGAAVDFSHPNHVILGSEQLLELTGEGWRPFGMPFPFGPMASVIVFAPSNPRIIYVGAADHNCMVHHSSCVTTRGLAVSKDGGETWNDISGGDLNGQGITDLAVDPLDADIVYAAAEQGVYQSIDGGMNWKRLTGLPEGQGRMVAVNPTEPSIMFASIHERGFYASHDGGSTWEQVSSGLGANGSHHKVVFDPINPQVIYTTDTFSGAYRSSDGGLTWEQINTGLDSRAVTGLAISANGNHVYLGTNGAGIYRLDLDGKPPVSKIQTSTDISSPAPAPQESGATLAGDPTQVVQSDQVPPRAPSGFGLYFILGTIAAGLLTIGYLIGRRRRKT